MSIWWAIPAFVGLVGVLMLVGGLGRLFQLKLFSGSLRFLFGGLTLAGAAIIGLIGLNLQTYKRLTHENLVAEVSLDQTSVSQFTATVRKADKQGVLLEPKDYALAGDKFRMEARVWKLQPWANVIGADAFYRLERIQGRWDDAARENSTPSTADDSIKDDAGMDVLALPFGKYTPFQQLDTTFGSGAYMPMVDGAIYEISMSQSGFVARGKNETAVNALNAWTSTGGLVSAPGPLVADPAVAVPASPNTSIESAPLPPAQAIAPPG
ncbi:MAG: hypothetical protein SGJ21_01800 [Alphaproteobacteria bacterium]|nr:hypothetical protein [Alphaproteobacteria bacterium]